MVCGVFQVPTRMSSAREAATAIRMEAAIPRTILKHLVGQGMSYFSKLVGFQPPCIVYATILRY